MEFQYSDNEQKTFNFLALTVHTRPNIATTYQEIDNFKYNLNELTSEPCFLTENAIILGDFNQSPSYVGTINNIYIKIPENSLTISAILSALGTKINCSPDELVFLDVNFLEITDDKGKNVASSI